MKELGAEWRSAPLVGKSEPLGKALRFEERSGVGTMLHLSGRSLQLSSGANASVGRKASAPKGSVAVQREGDRVVRPGRHDLVHGLAG
jgi:hypothetical protein